MTETYLVHPQSDQKSNGKFRKVYFLPISKKKQQIRFWLKRSNPLSENLIDRKGKENVSILKFLPLPTQRRKVLNKSSCAFSSEKIFKDVVDYLGVG